MSDPKSILITGAAGYIGAMLVDSLAADPAGLQTIVATDVCEPKRRHDGIIYRVEDVRDPRLGALIDEYEVDTVVHLASIVTPPKGTDAEFAYSVDVLGTQNVLDCCVRAGVEQLVVTSSGAAYGYWPDNPEWLKETDAIRGNDTFPYSRHKRLVEEMLADYRDKHPALKQLILRPGTILGKNISNQITNLFHKKVVMGIKGSDAPFVIIWDEDVVGVIRQGVLERKTGIYNLAGDGTIAMPEIARRIGKRYIAPPAWLIQGLLAILKPLGIVRYGPEQVNFLRYRPVLDNRALKEEFGYTPRLSSAEVFDLYWQHNPDE